MRKDKILKKAISWMLAFVMVLSLAAPAQVKAASSGEVSGTSDTSAYDALMQSDIEAAEPASSAMVGWITSNQTETETTTSFERAIDQWVDYEWSNENSTYRKSWLNFSMDGIEYSLVKISEQLTEMAGNPYGFSVLINAADKFYDARQIMENLADTQYSDSSHASIRAFEVLIESYDVIADVAFSLFPSLPTFVAKELAIVLSYGRDFLETEEVSNWLNSQNPTWLRILDWICEFGWLDWINDRAKGNETDLLIKFLLWRLRVPKNVNAYKPNIYLYGSAGETWTLTFDEPELLQAVLPEYEDAWTVTIAEDGSLTVNGEGSYGYLFYEASTLEGLMQKETGFVLNASDREGQLREILTQYGFNETEINDFVEYWCEKLDADTAYIMCPQTTEAVDWLMPITLEGEVFDHYTRIWFYFEECDPAATLSEPEIEQVFHDGNALVEWGGVAK